MTQFAEPRAGQRPRHPDAPEVTVAGTIPASAGKPAEVPVKVVHVGRRPARVRVTIFGLDEHWVPAPLDLGLLQPGDAAVITLTIAPERGALGASYPFTIAAEAIPAAGPTGAAGPASTGLGVVGVAESVLVVGAAERVSMTLDPSTPSAVFSRAIRVNVTNPSGAQRTFSLAPSAAAGARLRLRSTSVTVPAQQTVTVRGRIRVKKPSIFGGQNTHTFTIAAQGTGAPEWVEGTLRSTPLFGKGLTAIVGVIAIVAVWVALAIVFIPKISNAFKPKSATTASVSTTEGGSGANGAGGANVAGGSGTSGANGAGGAGGSGANGAGGAAGGLDAAGYPIGGYQLTGTVTGPGAQGSSVTLAPVSLASASDDGSLPTTQAGPGAGPKALRGSESAFTNDVMHAAAAPTGAADSSGPLGKLRGPLAGVNRDGFHPTTVLTTDKGEFGFSGVTAPGYYLLTVAKTGFTTQRFLVNSVNLASPQPMKINLEPGTGKLSGRVTGPTGAVGAATVVVTDGTVTLQTSSVSASTHTGAPGTWTLDQVSTPGTYLVTASAPGLGAASKLVTLDASGSATVDLQLSAGLGTITGMVTGEDALGVVGGLGGITVSATDGQTTRTATTVTSAAMRGAFVLPNLPAPGKYTLTISGTGFLTQTRDVSLTAGSGSVTVNATLSRADAVVSGTVTGLDANGKSQGGLGGVGLVLASNNVTMKTMTASGATAGAFQFSGVAPGSYVLTATQFGRVAASATVDVAAASAKSVDLVLKADIGAELPATAHIRGQVADSRTGGPLSCDRALQTVSAADCVATVTVVAPVDPADASKGTVTYTATATAALNFVYTIPDVSDASAGLPPGLYTVTVKAPGYEDSVTHVQVAQGQTMPAPVASMAPLGIISGTITTRIGTPSAASCVAAVPGTISVSANSLHCTVNGSTCSIDGISSAKCALTSLGGSGQAPLGTFAVRGLTHGQYQMVLISQDPEYVYTVGAVPIVTLELGTDGQFNAVLDRLGRINLTVEKIDPTTGQLVPVDANDSPSITIATAPNGTAGAPHLLAGQPVGSPVLTQLAAGSYNVTVTATVVPSGGGTAQSVSVTGMSAPVALNQSAAMTLIVAQRSGAIVGRVITNVGDNTTPTAVPNAVVTIRGTVVSLSGTSNSGLATVKTDARGCYAIVPEGWDTAKNSELTSPVCTTAVDSGSIQSFKNGSETATLISDNINIAVGPTTVGNQTITDAYQATDTTVKDCPPDGNGGTLCGNSKVRIISPIAVTAEPLAVTPTLDVVGPATGFTTPNLSSSPSPVHISVVSKPVAAGAVTLAPAPAPAPGASWTALGTSCTSDTGANVASATCFRAPLTFRDATLGSSNTARPGLYQLSVSVDGFNPTTIYLLCKFGQASCVFVPAASSTFGDAIRLAVMQKPQLSVDVSLPVTGGKYATDAWTFGPAQVQQTAGTTLNSVAIQGDGTTPGADPGTVAAIKAYLTFGSQRTILAPDPGPYKFTITDVKGYNGTTTVSADCGVDFTQPCVVSQPQSATAYPTFDKAGSTVALDQPAPPIGASFKFSDIAATVTSSNGSNLHISVTQEMESDGTTPATNADGDVYGHITWTDSTPGLLADQTVPRVYTVTFSLPGFVTSDPVTVDCTSSGPCSAGAITLKRLPYIFGTLTIPLAATAASITIPAGAITVTSPTGSTVTVTTPASVSGAKGAIVTAKMTWMDSAVGIEGLVPGRDYTATVSLDGYQDLTLHCDVSGSPVGNECDASGTLVLNPQPTMKLTILPGTPTATAPTLTVTGGKSNVNATVDTSGNIMWKQQGATGVVAPSTSDYVLTATLTGYDMSPAGPVNFTCTTSRCDFPPIVLTKKTDLTVNIEDSSHHTITSNARIALGSAVSSSPITQNGSATFTGTSTASVKQTGGVWSDDSYQLSVDAAGYRFVSGLDHSAPSVSCTNGTDTLTGVHLFPGGTTTCTVTLTSLGTISGTTSWDAVALPPNANGPIVTPLSGVTLTATQGTVTVSAKATSGTDGNGFTLAGTVSGASGASDVEGLKEGTWDIAASPVPTGYEPLTGTVTIGCVTTPPSPPPSPDPGPGPDADGYCAYGYTITGVTTDNSTSKSYLALSGQSVSVHLVPTPVKLTVQLGNLTTLPDGQVTLHSDAGGSWTCTMPTAGGGDKCTPSTSAGSIEFDQVPPGSYTLSATFGNGKYSTITSQPVTVEATGQDQTFSLQVTALITKLVGAIQDANSTPIANATVQLCTWPVASGCTPASDFDGATVGTVSSQSDGTYSIPNLQNGTYGVKITHAGFQDWVSPNVISINYPAGNTVPTATLAPSSRNVKMTFTLPAGLTGLSLTNATVKLTQTAYGGRPIPTTPVVQTGTISGDGSATAYTLTFNQLPTGAYDATVLPQTGAPLPLSADAVPVGKGTTELDQTVAVSATNVTLTVISSDAKQKLPADVPITLSNGSASASPNPELTLSNSDKTTASSTFYLSSGTYSWAPTLPSTGWDGWSWAGGAQQVVVTTGGSTPASPSATLTAPTPTVTVTITNGGTALTAGQDVTVNVLGTSSETCASKTATGGTVACTGLSASTSYGVTATWTDTSANPDITYAGYAVVTTTAAAFGSATVDLTSTPSALVTVTDDANQSVSGSSVTVYKPDGSTLTTAAPDSAGNAFITGLTAGDNYYAVASTSAKKSTFLNIKATANTLSEGSVELAATVSLKVTVSDASGPVSGASVVIRLNDQKSILLGSGQTAGDGTTTIADLPAVTYIEVVTSMSGYETMDQAQVPLGSSPTPYSVTLTSAAPTTASTTVTIKASDGSLLANKAVTATLTPNTGSCGTTPTTNTNGEIQCTGLDLSTPYSVEVTYNNGTKDLTNSASFTTNSTGGVDSPPVVTLPAG